MQISLIKICQTSNNLKNSWNFSADNLSNVWSAIILLSNFITSVTLATISF